MGRQLQVCRSNATGPIAAADSCMATLCVLWVLPGWWKSTLGTSLGLVGSHPECLTQGETRSPTSQPAYLLNPVLGAHWRS